MLLKVLGACRMAHSCGHWLLCVVLAAASTWLCAVAVAKIPLTIPLLCSYSWLGGTRVIVGKIFQSTGMAWSALCPLWAWLTCSGTAVLRKIMCFVCQCSQQPLKILPSQILVDEGLLDLPGCDGFYLLSCCSFLLPTHSNPNFWTICLLSALNFCHASHPAQLLSECN